MPPFRVSSSNIRIGWKGLSGTKHSSLLGPFVNFERKKYYNIGPLVEEFLTYKSKICVYSTNNMNIELIIGDIVYCTSDNSKLEYFIEVSKKVFMIHLNPKNSQ